MKTTFNGNLFYANVMIALIAACALAADLKSGSAQEPVFENIVTTLLR